MAEKRNLQSADLLFGGDEGSALWLVDELNGLENRAAADSLAQLIHDLNDMIRFARKKGFLAQGRLVGSKAIALWRKINSRLKDVNWGPYLSPPSGKEGLTFHWGPVSAPIEDRSQFMAGAAFNLAAAGLLRKIRQCKHCEKTWFFRKREDQRFCAVNCRVDFYRKTPEGRARNAKYMRGYRARLKRREQEVLRVARRGG